MDILERKRVGIWNVPFVSGCYLMSGSAVHGERILKSQKAAITFSDPDESDPNVAFARNMRDGLRIHLYVSNTEEFGTLVDTEGFRKDRLNNDLYTVISNPKLWDKK